MQAAVGRGASGSVPGPVPGEQPTRGARRLNGAERVPCDVMRGREGGREGVRGEEKSDAGKDGERSFTEMRGRVRKGEMEKARKGRREADF